MKYELIDHEPMNNGSWTKEFEYTKDLGSMGLNGTNQCTWYGLKLEQGLGSNESLRRSM